MMDVEADENGGMGLSPEDKRLLAAQGGRPDGMGGAALQHASGEGDALLTPAQLEQVEGDLGIETAPKDEHGIPYGELGEAIRQEDAAVSEKEEILSVPHLRSETDDPNAAVLEFNPHLGEMPASEFTKIVAEFMGLERQIKELEALQDLADSTQARLEKVQNAIDQGLPGEVSRIMHNIADAMERAHIRGEQTGTDGDRLKTTQGAYHSALTEQLGELGRFRKTLETQTNGAYEALEGWANKWREWPKDSKSGPEESSPQPDVSGE